MSRGLGFAPGNAPPGGATTWDPAAKGAGVALTSANRVMSVAGATPNTVISTTSKALDSGKFYAEMTVAAAASVWVGFAVSSVNLASYLGSDAAGQGYSTDGNVYLTGASEAVYATYGLGATIGLAIDTASGVRKLWWSKNGVYQSGNPALGSGGLTFITNPIFLAATAVSGASVRLNCGQESLVSDPPTGFAVWG